MGTSWCSIFTIYGKIYKFEIMFGLYNLFSLLSFLMTFLSWHLNLVYHLLFYQLFFLILNYLILKFRFFISSLSFSFSIKWNPWLFLVGKLRFLFFVLELEHKSAPNFVIIASISSFSIFSEIFSNKSLIFLV